MNCTIRNIAAALMLLLLPASGRLAAQQEPEPRLADADSLLVDVAATLVAAAPAISRTWPGFWPLDAAFVLLRPMSTVLLVTPRRPPPEFSAAEGLPLPKVLSARAYLRRGYLPGLTEHSFHVALPLGSDTVPALAPRGRGPFERLDFFLHESFHGWQLRNFAETPEDRRRAGFRQPLADTSVTGTLEFRLAVERERLLLLTALDAVARDSLERILRQYLEVRRARSGRAPDVIDVERRMERREGTAQYVGCIAAAAALLEPSSRALDCIREELAQDLDERPGMPEADARLMRWRLYGTGAAIAWLLDRLAPDWKPLVQRGMHLDQLIAQAIDFDPSAAETANGGGPGSR